MQIKYSFVDEKGNSILFYSNKNLRIGEIVTHPGNQTELLYIDNIIEKTSSQKIANEGSDEPKKDYTDDDAIDDVMNGEEVSIDIHIEAEPDVIDKMIDNIINGIDSSDKLEGGKADDVPDEEFDEEQLDKGKDVEKEHTDDDELAKEIAKDHLEESGNYYKDLEKMENKEKKESSKTATVSSNLGVWVATLSKKLPEDQLSQLHNILNQFLPEQDGRDYFEIIKGIDALPFDQKERLGETLKETLGMSTYANIKEAVSPPGRKHEVEQLKEKGVPEEEAFGIAWKQYNEKGKPKKESKLQFSNKKLSFDDPYDTQSDFYNDRGSYDRFLNEPDDLYDSMGEHEDELTNVSIGDSVKVIDPESDQFGMTGNVIDRLEFNSFRVNINGEDYHLYRDEIEKVGSKIAADISDQIPPMSSVTDESKTEKPDPNAQPLPPKPELNNQPGDVLYDSNKEQKGQGKFQVTTDPVEKEVTVKFLPEDDALNQAINEGVGMKPQPLTPPGQQQQQSQFPQPGQNPQQKQFEDTNSQVMF